MSRKSSEVTTPNTAASQRPTPGDSSNRPTNASTDIHIDPNLSYIDSSSDCDDISTADVLLRIASDEDVDHCVRDGAEHRQQVDSQTTDRDLTQAGAADAAAAADDAIRPDDIRRGVRRSGDRRTEQSTESFKANSRTPDNCQNVTPPPTTTTTSSSTTSLRGDSNVAIIVVASASESARSTTTTTATTSASSLLNQPGSVINGLVAAAAGAPPRPTSSSPTAAAAPTAPPLHSSGRVDATADTNAAAAAHREAPCRCPRVGASGCTCAGRRSECNSTSAVMLSISAVPSLNDDDDNDHPHHHRGDDKMKSDRTVAASPSSSSRPSESEMTTAAAANASPSSGRRGRRRSGSDPRISVETVLATGAKRESGACKSKAIGQLVATTQSKTVPPPPTVTAAHHKCGVDVVDSGDVSQVQERVCGGAVDDDGAMTKRLQIAEFELDDEDPYAKLEYFLENVKREINEAFEKHNHRKNLHLYSRPIRNQPPANELYPSSAHHSSMSSHTLPSTPKSFTSRTTSSTPSQSSSPEHHHHSHVEVVQTTNEWANNILRELDTLMPEHPEPAARSSQSLASLLASIPRSADQQVGHQRPPQTSVRVSSLAGGRTRGGAAPNGDGMFEGTSPILKPKKHSYIPLQSFNLDESLINNALRSPRPSYQTDDPSPAININYKLCNSDTYPILKIDEDQFDRHVAMRSSATQTSDTSRSNSKKGSTLTIWTSDESILKSSNYTVDEDNKSSSSSACEEASGVMSSGKSGNSLDSTEMDNIESGIGTATPPKDQEHLWRNRKPLILSSFPKQSWSRTDSVQTQTSPSAIGNNMTFFKNHHHQSAQDDPDLLEVLSMCEDIADTYDSGDDDDDVSIDQMIAAEKKSLDCSFGTTDSSCSTRSLLDEDVVLRNNNNHINHNNNNVFENNMVRQQIVSSPVNYSSKYLRNKLRASDKSRGDQQEALVRREAFGSFDRRPFGLHIGNEPFANIGELPSPSSASLHSGGHEHVTMQELTTKSNSAPILLKKEKRRDDFGGGQKLNLRYSRSQSDRYLAEIEAIEACKWLRAAGFPQYAQMYEDLQFPIDLSNVAKDHPFLENDPLQSLYRRLVALNRCATMRLDNVHKPHGAKDESEEEEYALSENWTFEQKNRRWSRVGEMMTADIAAGHFDKSDKSTESRDSSVEKLDLQTGDPYTGFSTLPKGSSYSSNTSSGDADTMPVRFRRTGSERIKDGAKALLRRVESIKSRRRKRQNRDGVVISGPQELDLTQISSDASLTMARSQPPSPMPGSPFKLPGGVTDLKTEYSNQNRLSPLNYSMASSGGGVGGGRKHNQSVSTRTSPLHFFNTSNIVIDVRSGDESSSYFSDASQESSGGGGGGTTSGVNIPKKRPSRTRRFLQKGGSKVEDIGAMSDSECSHLMGGLSQTKSQVEQAKKTPDLLKPMAKLTRGGSLNLGKDSQRQRDGFKSRSFRSRSSCRKADGGYGDDEKATSKAVQRWHSFQSHDRPDFMFKKCFAGKERESLADGMPLDAMSCGQIQAIRKLALVTLTGYMERYCPTHRSGWNWEFTKFIKKIKAPDYKDRKVFGVPFLLLLQRSGDTLPRAIQSAIKWLKLNAMDQIGIFRKSGVKSRIAKLKEVVEESPVDQPMSVYDIQQAYDVADMVKQYFRELPDMLLTAKLSETFVAIFLHLPPDVRPDAVQYAVLLLPDEHREVLHHLLEFLSSVAANAQFNQMTANNLAVCLAPSLFHGGVASMRTVTASPRRRKPTGVPDDRELSETKASHECLTYLIENCRTVFTISNEKIARCNFGYMEESRPVTLGQLGSEHPGMSGWQNYLVECTRATLKEGREKTRGWISMSSFDGHVDIGYKKVGDGHPLRLWRCTTEVDATPHKVMEFILRDRQKWDNQLLKWRMVRTLDERSEIFQYAVRGGQSITDYCVLRSYTTNISRSQEACVIVETSIEHPDASLLLGGVRGVVLASRYLIEPSGSNKSKIMHLARVDIKGKTPEWYNKSYGHICAHHLAKIRTAFSVTATSTDHHRH